MIFAKKRNKNPEFGIIVTDKTNGLYLRELMDMIRKHSTRPAEASVLLTMEPGDVIIFDTPEHGSAKIKLIDYRKLGEVGSEYDHLPLYDLVDEFAKVTKAVKNYFNVVGFDKKVEPKSLLEALLLIEEGEDLSLSEIIVVENTRRKKPKTKKRRLGWEKQTLNGKSVDIYEYWVKVGNGAYDIMIDDETGEEYFRINSTRVYIDRTNPNYPYLYTE